MARAPVSLDGAPSAQPVVAKAGRDDPDKKTLQVETGVTPGPLGVPVRHHIEVSVRRWTWASRPGAERSRRSVSEQTSLASEPRRVSNPFRVNSSWLRRGCVARLNRPVHKARGDPFRAAVLRRGNVPHVEHGIGRMARGL